jgi:RNA polymerase sigma-70 factor (ECF subfamily)
MTSKRASFHWFVRRAESVDWDTVYTELMPRVFNFFRYRVENTATAEDLTATTLMRAWQGRERYSNDLSSFPTWVFGIARHVAADHFRRRDRSVSLETAKERAEEMRLEDTVERRGEIERLRGLLNGLSEREREVIALKYGADLTNREIGQVMKLSETNVSTLASRVVSKLRMEWENHEPSK